MSFLEIVGLCTVYFFAAGKFLLAIKILTWPCLKWKRARLVKKYLAMAWDDPKIIKVQAKITEVQTAIEKY